MAEAKRKLNTAFIGHQVLVYCSESIAGGGWFWGGVTQIGPNAEGGIHFWPNSEKK